MEPAKRLPEREQAGAKRQRIRELAVGILTNKHFPLNPVDSITLKV